MVDTTSSRQGIWENDVLRTSMQASDVTETLDLARVCTGVDRVQVREALAGRNRERPL